MAATDDVVQTFTSLMGELDYPMFIVTTVADDGERSGCLIGFAPQISIDPPRSLTGLSKKNHTCEVGKRAEHIGVHFVPADGEEIAELFGGETGDEIDKFERCEWHEGPEGGRIGAGLPKWVGGREGAPTAAALPNWFVGRIVERLSAGDHDAIILEPVGGERQAEEQEFT